MEQKRWDHDPYWQKIWRQFQQHRLGMAGLFVIIIFCLVGVYAPFLASSKPFTVYYNHEWYFPFFRYLFYSEFYTKRLDVFFNLLIFTLPLMCLVLYFGRTWRFWLFTAVVLVQFGAFIALIYWPVKDPAADANLTAKLKQFVQKRITSNQYVNSGWKGDLEYLSPYAKLNLLLRYKERKAQDKELEKFAKPYEAKYKRPIPSLWNISEINERDEIDRQEKIIKQSPDPATKEKARDKIAFLVDRKQWLEEESSRLKYIVMPLIRPFHWEDDAGGAQSLNQYVPWWELTRVNRKDLVAALIFGVRISLVVGLASVGLSLLIGIPIGAFAGFYGGKLDIVVSRLLEIWESLPTFFMLLMVVAITQSKSIFLVISIIGFFGWTGFSRYIRGEFFKQRNLSYVEACRSLGFSDGYIMFRHILPNAIPPILTLLPFAIMGAITSEAGLSFLGLGEEGSCSWGVLMDEGRSAFPGESFLLWPPAIFLTVLLVAIALVGDALRDTLDPKMHKSTAR